MKVISSAGFRWLVPVSAALAMAACGGGGGSGTGSLTVGVTDAPVDGAEAVVVAFTKVTVHKADGTTIEFPYDGEPIDLLQFQDPVGEPRAVLVDSQSLEAGEYNWIRLDVEAVSGVRDSYITIGGQEYDLRVPSGVLKLNRPFTVPQGGLLDITLDFDLRKSVTKPAGDYILRPTVRIVDTAQTGTLSGTVDGTFLTGNCGGYTAGNVAVYVYEGEGVTPVEMDSVDPDPLVTAWVNDEGGIYSYRVPYLTAGTYTVALTCNANEDTPDAVEGTIVFVDTAPSVAVTVDGGTQDFPTAP